MGCDAFDFKTKGFTPGPLSKYKSTVSDNTITNTFFGKLPQSIINLNTNNGTPDASTVNMCIRSCTINEKYKGNQDSCKANCLCCSLPENCPTSAVNSSSGCCMQVKARTTTT